MPPTRNIDLHLLECFTMLMREQNVSRAAERMGLSQSAMSEALGRLRERFADPLFVRGRRGMQPTPRAQELLAKVFDVSERLRDLVEEGATFSARSCTRRFRLVASDYVQLLLMPGLVTRLAEAAPDASVDVLPIHIRRVPDALESGEADLAIAYFVDPPAGLKRRQLLRERFVGVARRGHPAIHADLTVKELAALRHVSVAPSGLNYFSGALDAALERRGLRRQLVATSPHFLLAATLVAETDLVLVLPMRAARGLVRRLPLSLFELPVELPPVQTGMYWHMRTHDSPAHAWLRGLVHEVLQHTAA